MPQTLFLLFAALAAYFTKGITGFGNTLVMGTLFSFAVPNRLTTPVDLLLSIPTNAWMVWHNRRQLSARIVVPLSLLLIAGILPGVFFLKLGNDWMLKAGLGLVVSGLAVEMWLRSISDKPAGKVHPALLACIGIASGILSGMYGIGALLVAYVGRTTEGRGAFRANLCCVFLIENLFRFILYWRTGLFTPDVWKLALLLIPAVVAGMFAGMKADRRLDEARVRSFTIMLLLVSGLVLFFRNLLAH